MKMIFDAFDDGDDFACTRAGEIVDPCKGRWKTASCQVVCDEADVTTPAKLAVARRRMTWAANHISRLIRLPHRKANISISSQDVDDNYRNMFPGSIINEGDQDLVIIANLRKHENDYVAGYAGCIATDAYNRCILGFFNFCPRVLDVDAQFSPDVMDKERRTALHEIFHVLGGIKLEDFRRNDGEGSEALRQRSNPLAENAYLKVYSAAFKKNVIHVQTPKVLKLWRAQTGCATSPGPPLEDTPLGVGAHWEARTMGPEVMSYGTLSGESYLSDLTLAFLEDTGHYVANYEAAGRLLIPSTNKAVDEVSLFFASSERPATNAEMIDNLPEVGPGYLRWGRHAGCSFFEDLPTSWDKRYTCTKDGHAGCTPDFRASAVCSIVQYDSANPVPTAGSAYSTRQSGFFQDVLPKSDTCWKERTSYGVLKTFCRVTGRPDDISDDAYTRGSYPQVPDSLAVNGNKKLGGWNSAMDFAPVMASYWNCQDQRPVSTSSNFVEGGSSGMNLGDIVDKTTKATLTYGGQTRCPNCRCFSSSLQEFSLGLIGGVGVSYGLCYRFNCPTSNHLQVGVRGSSGTYWYDCRLKEARLSWLASPGLSPALQRENFAAWRPPVVSSRPQQILCLSGYIGAPF